jgi:ribosomal protein L17
MRHRKKRSTLLESGAKKKSIVLRNLLTSLVLHGSITTTPAKARSLKAFADKFFSGLMRSYTTYSTDQDALRENIRVVKATIYGEDAGKKVIRDLLPQFKEKKQESFIANYKLGFRPGDSSMKILVKLI